MAWGGLQKDECPHACFTVLHAHSGDPNTDQGLHVQDQSVDVAACASISISIFEFLTTRPTGVNVNVPDPDPTHDIRIFEKKKTRRTSPSFSDDICTCTCDDAPPSYHGRGRSLEAVLLNIDRIWNTYSMRCRAIYAAAQLLHVTFQTVTYSVANLMLRQHHPCRCALRGRFARRRLPPATEMPSAAQAAVAVAEPGFTISCTSVCEVRRRAELVAKSASGLLASGKLGAFRLRPTPHEVASASGAATPALKALALLLHALAEDAVATSTLAALAAVAKTAALHSAAATWLAGVFIPRLP